MSLRLAPLLLLALAGCRDIVAPRADYRPTDAGTVDHALCLLGFTAAPMRSLVTGHHLIEARLNGRPATFIVDTGANISVVHAPLASRYGLTEGTGVASVAVGLGGGMKARQLRLETLALGDVAIRQRRIMAADLSAMTGVLGKLGATEITGIIGQDVLAEHRAVIDVRRPILYLIAADRAPAPVESARCAERPSDA